MGKQGNNKGNWVRTSEFPTPEQFYKEIDKEFHFTLDAAASKENHKCGTYFTKEENGLQKNWGGTEYSVIRHMGMKQGNGYEKHMKKETIAG